jgi:hypothetical protein
LKDDPMPADPAPASTAPAIDPERITHYHAHIYYDPQTRDRAARLREAHRFTLQSKFGDGYGA